MGRIWRIWRILGLAVFLFSAPVAAMVTDYLLPAPQLIIQRQSAFVVNANTPVRLSGVFTDADQFSVRLVREQLLSRAVQGEGSKAGIALKRINDWSEHFGARPVRDLGNEGYVLEVSKEQGITATATSSRGLYYAAQTLVQLGEMNDGHLQVPAMEITDWPDVKNRMVLYDLRYNSMDLEYTKRWIRTLSRLKINQFMIFMSGDYVYQKYPFIASPEKLTHEKLIELKSMLASITSN